MDNPNISPSDLMISGIILAIVWPWMVILAVYITPWPFNIAAAVSMMALGFAAWIALGYYISTK